MAVNGTHPGRKAARPEARPEPVRQAAVREGSARQEPSRQQDARREAAPPAERASARPPVTIGILAVQGDFEAHAAMLERLGIRAEAPERGAKYSERAGPECEAAAHEPAAAEKARGARAHEPAEREAAAQEPAAGQPQDRWRYVRSARDLDGLDGLILPGGESTTMLKFLDDPEFWTRLRDTAASVPTFGTCAGAILLAKRVSDPEQRSLAVLDAEIRRNAYGRQVDSSIRRGTAVFDGPRDDTRDNSVETGLEMVFIRAPRFQRLGPPVKVLATESEEPVMVRQGNVLAATFHPELTQDARVHEYFLGMVRRHAAAGTAKTGH
jgi:5'-phosphate synthase pdxT subunit